MLKALLLGVGIWIGTVWTLGGILLAMHALELRLERKLRKSGVLEGLNLQDEAR